MSQLDLFTQDEPRKRCPRCRDWKPFEDFPRNRSTKDGRQAYCKPCYTVVIREHKTRRYGSERNFKLQHRYGIDEATFDRLFADQGGRCAICRRRKAKHVDHCHSSQRIRGLLCVKCNNGLGKFEDDISLMQTAIDYLEGDQPL
jgi:Recombination endonuclease VII